MKDELISEETRFLLGELKNVILLILTTIDLIFIFLSLSYSVSFKVENVFADYDLFICLLLFLDLSYEYYHYKGSMKDFMIKDRNILTLISILPFDIIFRYFSVFRLFKFLKVIKIVRIYTLKRDYKSLIYFIQNHLFKLLLIILLVYLSVASWLLIVIDNSVTNLSDAVWYIIVTASTVGFGDIIPTTAEGKALSLLTIFIGIISVAIFTAYLSAIYNEKQEMQTRVTLFKHIDKVEKNNKVMKIEIMDLNRRLEQMEEQNIHLNRKLSQMEDTMEKILEKLDEKK